MILLDANCPNCGIPVTEADAEQIAASFAADSRCGRCAASIDQAARNKIYAERERLRQDLTVESQRVPFDTPDSLKRNVLTPHAKRWQLWGKGVKGKEADELMAKLYG